MSATGYDALPSDGFRASWSDDRHTERLTLTWENEAWTAVGTLEASEVEYVLRLTAQWHVSQFLLFRDLQDPDLWLGTDGAGRWGEVNGAHRPDLDGAHDISLAGSSFTPAVPIRRLPLEVGHAADLSSVVVDVDTLGVVPTAMRFERLEHARWRIDRGDGPVEFEVDRFGLPLDVGTRRRDA